MTWPVQNKNNNNIYDFSYVWKSLLLGQLISLLLCSSAVLCQILVENYNVKLPSGEPKHKNLPNKNVLKPLFARSITTPLPPALPGLLQRPLLPAAEARASQDDLQAERTALLLPRCRGHAVKLPGTEGAAVHHAHQRASEFDQGIFNILRRLFSELIWATKYFTNLDTLV